jgi:hypothetical protein
MCAQYMCPCIGNAAKTPMGLTLSVDFNDTVTPLGDFEPVDYVTAVKDRTYALLGFPVDRQILTYNRAVMEDNVQLFNYDLPFSILPPYPDTTVQLTMRQPLPPAPALPRPTTAPRLCTVRGAAYKCVHGRQ